MNIFCHESSYIDNKVEIGEGTKIWHFSHIQKGATIGRNCTIGQNVNVASDSFIGDGVKIQNNVSVYDSVIIEDDVFIGPSVVFSNVIRPRAFIEQKDNFQPTIIKKGATIGANATIICGNNIGEYAMVGAGTVVTRDVSAHALFYGSPGKVHGWVCKCGNKLEEIIEGLVCPMCKIEDDLVKNEIDKKYMS